MKLYIRNMACETCKVYMRDVLTKMHFHPTRVELGEVDITEEIEPEEKVKLNSIIRKVGLELVENNASIIIEKIKRYAFDYVRAEEYPTENFSTYLTQKLKYDYNYLSGLFSDVESYTITHYLTLLKIEYAKELIIFDDISLSKISEKLHYSNVAHFSAQFKKCTGFPPSHFKKVKNKRRLTIHELNEELKKK